MASDYSGDAALTLPGANRILKPSTSHFSPITERSNRVQDGAIRLLAPYSQPGPLTKANPLGNKGASNG